ncbi:spore coat assembly protein [Ruminiclostridium sufflavum DSM 19573]|uniref:Spore coat assembly protein n=1 Tax=Ruminiclostridium sufflavum DSM 19573 TaxID=1121337 RepID=A0A318XRZ1_9FIRM|nr:sporulation peptidase YabG [Ruminiclostridium sufflavum]PYG89011.1 spore coat assembly protein [Ruminiclostridium sufflavum DSM 19573]
MQKIEIGNLVYRKSYEKDVLFRVSDIIFDDGKKIFILKGVNVRLQADAEEDDLDIIGYDKNKLSGNIY